MIHPATSVIVAAISVMGFAVGSASTAQAHSLASSSALPIGDDCVVGRWVARNESWPGNWTWSGEVIPVSGLSGLVMTFTPDGTETDDLSHTQPLIGDYHGSQIKIVIRGSVTFSAHADGSQIVQSRGKGQPTVTFYRDGVLQPGGSITYPPGTCSYRCAPKSLHLEGAAMNAGYGPIVIDLTRSVAAPPGGPSVISTVGSSLAKPADLARAPVNLLVNVLITLSLVLLVTFPSHLLNRTYEENHDAIRNWWERRLPWLKRLKTTELITQRASIRAAISYAGVVLVGGVLASLLDPHFGPNLRTLALFLGAVLALTAGSIVGASAAGLYRVARHKAGPWRLHALPSALLVAGFCVFISRLTAFQPGYLYGLIGGIVFTRLLSQQEEGHVVAVSSIATLIISIGAWLFWVPVSIASAANPTAFGWALLSNFLAALFVSGMVGLLIGLVPLRFLPGEKLAMWHRRVWGAVFGLAGLAVVEVMLRPQTAGARVASVPFWTTLGLFVVFGTASVLFWSYFKVRDRAAFVGAAQSTESGRNV